MFLLWVNFKKLHLVWVLKSEMCSICLGHRIYGNLTLATISSEIIHCSVSTERTEMTWICGYLHCQETISVDWLAYSSKSLSAALSAATVLKSMRWIICKQAICCMTRRCERLKVSEMTAQMGAAHFHIIEKGKVPWWPFWHLVPFYSFFKSW